MVQVDHVQIRALGLVCSLGTRRIISSSYFCVRDVADSIITLGRGGAARRWSLFLNCSDSSRLPFAFPQVQTAIRRCGHQWCHRCLHFRSTLCHNSSDCCHEQVGVATGVVNGALLHPFNAIKYRCSLLLTLHHNAAFAIVPAL
jgi:hypothetical protein